MVLHTSEII
ncbi:hypothetical protein LINGRAHAP2_LOCUS17940 [Linum grandiflorum]